MADKLMRTLLTVLIYLVMFMLIIIFFGSGEQFVYEGF